MSTTDRLIVSPVWRIFILPEQLLLEAVLRLADVVDSGAIAGIQRPQWMTGSFVEQGTTEEERMVRDSTGPVGFVVALLLLSVRFLRRDVVSYVRSTLCVLMELRHVVTFAIWYQPEENAIPWEVDALGDYSIDLVSTFDAKIRDGYHDDNVQGTWKELTSLARGIADCKSSKRVFPDLQEPDHMVLESNPPDLARAFDENLIADNRVQVNRSKIPLGTTEKVLNAIPIKPRLTWMEFLCFPMILRKRKYQSNSAAILTNERAISISEYRPYQSVYEIGMTLYYIGDIGGGISVEDTKGHQGCSVDVCTPYGALRVNPIWSDLWPWSSTVGEGSYYNDLKRFVKTFQNACKGTQVLTPPQQRNVSGEELQRAKDVAGISESDTEKICSVVTCNEKQKDLEPFARFPPLAMISCGDVKCLGNLLETVTCGVRPIKRAQRLILTTHKLLAEHHVTNEEKAVQRTYTVWAPLTEVPALRTRGSFDLAPPGCCYWRCAAGIPICSRTSRRIDIEAGLSRSFDEAPLRLAQITFDVRQGPLELDDSNAMMNFVKEFNKYLLIKPVNEGIEREILNDRYGRGLPFPNGRGSYRYRPDDPTAQPEDIAVDVPPQGDSKEV